MKEKILIIGSGAIGGFYGGLLARQGADVSVVCRSDYQQVRQHGITIHSHSLGSWTFKPAQVLQQAADYQGSADTIILCTKVLPALQRAKLIRAAVGKHTAIAFIQNGVEIEQELQDAFPDNEIISGLAFICCNRIQPGKIDHLAYGHLALGNYPQGVSSKTRQLCTLFELSGITCRASQDIVTARWQKNVWNAPFNPLSVLSGGLLTSDILSHQESLVRSIMQEVCAIAAATGHPLPEDIVEKNITSTYAMPPYKTSMLLDYQSGRPMETEAILGNTVRAGQRTNTACPCLQTLYGLMKLRELQLSGQYRPS